MRSGEARETPFLYMSMPSEIEQAEKEFAVVVLTEDGTIVDAHDACKESFGWSRENLAGQDIGTLIPAHRGLLLTGILQSSDCETQLGEETTFSMRILAQRMDETSFPARLVVRRFGESDCWAVSFYHAAPLTPPDPHAPITPLAPSNQEPFSIMQCTALEETIEAEPAPSADPCDEGAAGAPFDSAEPFDFTDEALHQALNGEFPASLSTEEPQAENNQSSIIDDQSIPEPLAPFKQNTALFKKTKSATSAIKQSEAETDHQSQPDPQLLEQRVTSLTSQLSSLHSELRQHLEVQSRTEKKLSTFEEQLHETKKSLARATADLASHKAQAASGELESLRTLNKALEEHLALHKSANQALQRTSAEAERQLAAINAELNQTRTALAQETAKRQDLERKLTSIDQDRSAQERKSKLEICRLEAALKAKELELKQLELARSDNPPNAV